MDSTQVSKTRHRFYLASLLLLVIGLSACGGGDGGTPAPEPPAPTNTNSNWDSLVWDQDNWN